MTVVASPVHQPASVPVTERERRARTLEGAALEIEVRGWNTGYLEDSTGAVCIVGAIHYASSDRRAGWYAYADSVWWPTPEEAARNVSLKHFNDWAESAAEVTFLLRWRSAEIRDGL